VLEREKMHRFNRFYLLTSIVISLVIPFVTFEIIEIIPVTQNSELQIIDTIPSSSNETIIQDKINYITIILWSLYILTSSILIMRFVRNIWKLISKAISNPKVKYKNANLILLDEKTLPHTFLNYIYINFEDYNKRNIEDELYSHELVHVNQKHTLDILFIELLKVIFWFNPLFIFYKKAIQLNHEFLADEEIVKTYNNVPFYQNLLLQKSSNVQTIYLASNLNYLVTKKRLIMMTKNTSQTIAFLKKIAIVPILTGLIYFFCVEIIAQKKVVNSKADIKNIKADTLTRFVKEDKSYVLFKNDSIKKKKKTKKPEPIYCPEVTLKKNDKLNDKTTPDIKNLSEVKEEPTYIGGMEEFYKYIVKNFVIPTEARNDGYMIVSFVVEKDGSLNEINVVKDLGYGTGEEMIRVLKNSPKWNPGTINGEPVSVKHMFPIKIKTK
jgi:beta-lactamase regulating signal transducer with metallopeptidase domain